MPEPQPANADPVATQQRLLEMVNASWMAQAACVAVEFRVPDLLQQGPMTSEALAAATGTDGPSMHRLLRALASMGVCAERDDGRFEITQMGSCLAEGSPGSLRAWTLWWAKYCREEWGRLIDSVRTGRSARELVKGSSGIGPLEKDPAAAAVFNAAMAELTRLTTASVLEVCEFDKDRCIVDVGGGNGEFLAGVLCANPGARGVLLDRPHALAAARRRLDDAGVGGRCKLVEGDFFASVPVGGDAYILKSILHNWADEQALALLRRCREAMGPRPGGRLVVIERLAPDRLTDSPEHRWMARSDLHMLVAHGARERTEREFCALLASAEFAITRIVPAGPNHSVIEARPRAPETHTAPPAAKAS